MVLVLSSFEFKILFSLYDKFLLFLVFSVLCRVFVICFSAVFILVKLIFLSMESMLKFRIDELVCFMNEERVWFQL